MNGQTTTRFMKKELGIFILLVVLCIIVSAINPNFLLAINLQNLARQIGAFGIFSIGMGLVIITGGIELSVGSMFALLGIFFLELLINREWPWPLALLAALGGGAALGSIHGLLVTRMRMQPFVVTLCGLLIYRGVARWYTDDGTAGFEFGRSFPTLEWLTVGRTAGIPHSFAIFIVMALIMGVVLHRS